jgi:Zn-dependent protease
MSWSVKLVPVKGIDVRVHLTSMLILIWAAFNWSGSTGGGLQGALFGVAATLLLFVAVTLHELGHSLQALRYGVPGRDIILLPIGGVFAAIYSDGDPAHALTGVSTYAIAPGQGLVFDLVFQQPGKYPFVDHSMRDMGIGAMGVLDVRP